MTAWALGAAVLLLLANAFFVAVEFALIAARRTRIEPLAESGNRRARVALAAMQDLGVQLAGAQLGITMASLGLGFVAEPAVAELLVHGIEAVAHWPSGLVHTVAFVVALSIVVFLHMVLGEMVPKNIAIAGAERTLLWLAVPNRIYVTAFRWVIVVLNSAANGVVRVFGVTPPDELRTAHTPEELTRMLASSRREGQIDDFEHELLRGALHFGRRPAREVMVPRPGVVTVPRWATVARVEQAVVDSGHSRLPVTGGSPDELVGFVHAKDLLALPPEAYDAPLPVGVIRRMVVVGPDIPLEQLLLALQLARVHVAVVTESGRTLGIVTLEDLLEQLVGDIRDESDREGEHARS